MINQIIIHSFGKRQLSFILTQFLGTKTGFLTPYDPKKAPHQLNVEPPQIEPPRQRDINANVSSSSLFSYISNKLELKYSCSLTQLISSEIIIIFSIEVVLIIQLMGLLVLSDQRVVVVVIGLI